MTREWGLPGVDLLSRIQCQEDGHCPEPAKYEARFLCCNEPRNTCSGHRAQMRRRWARGDATQCPGCGERTHEERTTWREL